MNWLVCIGSFFGGAVQEKEEKLAWQGDATDPRIQAERDRLAAALAKREADQARALHAENMRQKNKLKNTDDRTDSDVMDEAAGRARLALAKLGEEERQAMWDKIAEENHEKMARIHNQQSKVRTWNGAYHQRISERKAKEHEIAVLLEEIKNRVQSGEAAEDREGLHALEKKLAKAQNWIVAPPTQASKQFEFKTTVTSIYDVYGVNDKSYLREETKMIMPESVRGSLATAWPGAPPLPPSLWWVALPDRAAGQDALAIMRLALPLHRL